MGNRPAGDWEPTNATVTRASKPLPRRLRLEIRCPIAWCGASFWLAWRTFWRGTRRRRRGSRSPSLRCSTGDRCPSSPRADKAGRARSLALYPLFAELTTRFDLEVKERGSLINGSPCAAALVADAALAARRRVRLPSRSSLCRSKRFGAPLEHYDPALDALWGDEHEAAALRGLREFLRADPIRRNTQALVSWRIVPRVLGHARRALAAAERAATVSLSSVSDNPVYLPPDGEFPFGRCISTGGYHNAMATPALDDLAAIWADICLLCDRHGSKLLNGRVSGLPDLLLSGREASESDGHEGRRLRPWMVITGILRAGKTFRAAHFQYRERNSPAPGRMMSRRRFFSHGARKNGRGAAWTPRCRCWRCSHRRPYMSLDASRPRRYDPSSRRSETCCPRWRKIAYSGQNSEGWPSGSLERSFDD